MAENPFILAIDQGTTSSRAIVFDRSSRIISTAQQEFKQYYPEDGWVEHDPEEIWQTSLAVSREALEAAEKQGGEVVAIGITNQRETTIVWDRSTNAPVHKAIVWQDRRTADICQGLRDAEFEDEVRRRAGLLLDPYFSASKIAWILDNVTGARAQAENGDLAFGTVDSFLIWRLTGGKSHVTDATNASRTSLYNIHDNSWDKTLLNKFRVPEACLPEVLDCAAEFGKTALELFGRPIPILGVAGDQQAAAIGQAGFSKGAIKSTYGTGCFVLVNTGDAPVQSKNNLLTTIGYRLNGETSYAIEGSIFVAGAAVQRLRDELQIIKNAEEIEALAKSLDDNQGVYLVPAFAGLGAPHWRPDARGAIYGLTRGSGRAALARAAIESVAYQTLDLMEAISADGVDVQTLRVDGGMVMNDWLMQFLADTLQLSVERPEVMETTALGVAYLAGLKAGVYQNTDEIAALWKKNAQFDPQMDTEKRNALVKGWRLAVKRTVTS